MYLIAEIAQAHDGSLGILHSYIDALANAGVDAVKFQTHIAQAESSTLEPFRINFSYEDATRYDYWERMEFTLDQWKGIKSHCDKVGVEFLSSPFSNAAVDVLEEVGIARYKIGSGEVSNFLLLEKIVKTGKPILLSSGMSSYEELDATVSFLIERGAEFSILQCTTSYPTQPENYGLNVIKELKDRYKVPVGFSDHSAKVSTAFAAQALGAELYEFHAVFNKEMFGPDAKASLDIDEIHSLVAGVRDLSIALNNPVDKSDSDPYTDLKAIFEKSLAVNKNLTAGHKITFEDLEAKKPAGQGIKAADFKSVIGKALVKDKSAWDFLKGKDYE